MEGISIVNHQGKKIYAIDFAAHGKTKEDTIRLITTVREEFIKNPLKSVLAIIDISCAFFHWDTFKAINNLIQKVGLYNKKIAILGAKGMRKTTLKTLAGRDGTIQPFDTEDQAKEWLILD
ncbi:MAG: STAS/SEC14 domain-containing protein [Firmicutes bacterium]|nr:STAS/SEC14 domain-containing protein [Bacillota bacterium]